MSRKIPYGTENTPAMAMAKAELSQAIENAILRRQWSQRFAAGALGTSQANISRAMNPESAKALSFNQLFRYLSRCDVRFKIMISRF